MDPITLELIIRYQSSNCTDTLLTLWHNFQPLLYTYIRKFFIPEKEKEDIKQEAFLVLLQCANSYDLSTKVPFESYYNVQLHFWFLNQLRKKQELLVVDHHWQQGVSMTNSMESTEKSPYQYTQDQELKQTIKNALHQLTFKQRKVLSMYYIDGLTMIEISKKMGCSYGVVYKHKAAGLKRLASHLYIEMYFE